MSQKYSLQKELNGHSDLYTSIKHSENRIARTLSEKLLQQLEEIVNNENSTLLHTSANNNNYDMAEYYLKSYDILISKYPHKYSQQAKQKWLMMKDNQGFSCLHYSVFRANFKMSQLFQKHGGDIYQINNQGLTVLHIAAQGDSPLLMYYYLNKGLKIGVTDAKGNTPLHWACYSGQENAVYALISWGAEIDRQESTFGMTPLHLAVMSGNGRIVKKLLIRGCDRNIKAFNGKLALDIAKENQYKNITEMIEDKQGIKQLMNIKTPFRQLHRHTLPFYILVILFTTTYALNISFILKESLEPQFGMVLVFLILGFIVFVLFIASTCSNPGILKPIEQDALFKTESKTMFQILMKYKPNQICFECRIIKPQRSRHCDICHSCIMVYDHHCPWIANCVGANNYWVFFLFLISMLLYMGFTIAFEILNFVYTDWSLHTALQIVRIICQFYCLIIAVIFILPLLFLIIVQVKNICTNKTTLQRYGFQRITSTKSARSSVQSSLSNATQSEQLRLKLVNMKSVSRDSNSNIIFENEIVEESGDNVKNCYKMFCGNRKNIRYQVGM